MRRTARREIEIIRRDLPLHRGPRRGAQHGSTGAGHRGTLEAGLDVWFFATVWDRVPEQEQSRHPVQPRRRRNRSWAPRPSVTFVVERRGTLFMREHPCRQTLSAGSRHHPLTASLTAAPRPAPRSRVARLEAAVRPPSPAPSRTHPAVGQVDWSRFDIVGIDHYGLAHRGPLRRDARPLLAIGKPSSTPVGTRRTSAATRVDAFSTTSTSTASRLLLHSLPALHRFVRPRVAKVVPRDQRSRRRTHRRRWRSSMASG